MSPPDGRRGRPLDRSAPSTELAEPSLTQTADDAAATWRRSAYGAIVVLARSGAPFTSDDVLALVGQPPRGRQLSGVFGVMRRRHRIRSIGAGVNRSGGLVRIWVGVTR
jgi:hypothetical protein